MSDIMAKIKKAVKKVVEKTKGINARCEVCGVEQRVKNLQKNSCVNGHAGLVAIEL